MRFVMNQKRRLISPLLIMGMTQSAMADEHHHDHHHHGHSAVEAHVHGEAKLNIIIDGQQVFAEFISPLDNLVGFEHEPQTTEQKQAYASLQQTLADHKVIFEIVGPTCTQVHQQASSPFNTQESHHAEWHAEYQLQCTGEETYTLHTPLFAHYPGVETVIVQSITRDGQAEHRLKQDSDKLLLQ